MTSVFRVNRIHTINRQLTVDCLR